MQCNDIGYPSVSYTSSYVPGKQDIEVEIKVRANLCFQTELLGSAFGVLTPTYQSNARLLIGN